MPFVFDVIIDNQRVNVQMGLFTSRKWEEALDEANMIIPFAYQNKEPYKMFSMVDIKITEIDNYTNRNVIEERELEYLVYSDRVENVGSYGYYKHTVNAIEYTSKLDYHIVRSLARSRSVIDKTQAPFVTHVNLSQTNKRFFARASLQHVDISATIRQNESVTFEQVYEAYVADNSVESGYQRYPAVIGTNAPLVSGTNYHVLSGSPATWKLPVGQWEIYYGVTVDKQIGLSGDYSTLYTGFNKIYTFYVEVVDENELSVLDGLNEIRDCVSKFGGLEDTIYYDSTRIFDIDPEYEEYLSKIQLPQTYLSNITSRKAIIYILSIVNALPRLKRGENIDILTIEPYNLSTGSFEREGIIGYGSFQNTNQIGSRNYLSISQGLTDNLDDPSISTPSGSGYQQVRSLDVQLTANNFAIKLPENYPLYMPKKLSVIIPYFEVFPIGGVTPLFSATNFELDLTARWINGEEWKLKEITENFPDIEEKDIWESTLGLREFKVENLSWDIGDTEIDLSKVFGEIFQDNLIRNVVKMAIYEWVMNNMPIPLTNISDPPVETFAPLHEVNISIPSTDEYKDWRFRVEYITDERLVMKQDKLDTSQISFYSEMQQNQEEALVNIVRQSRKAFGDLQRTGNIQPSFVKKHLSLSEFYEVGQKDSQGYTITQVDTNWFNEYAIASYHVTRYHNRIQQETHINQYYRPFDNFAKSVLERHEHYNDYLIALPPNDTESGVRTQNTKIYSNSKTVRRIVEILLGGEFGLPSEKTKASAALVRTDGMFDVYAEGNDYAVFMATPLSARGVEEGFVFTFGFKSNQVAGDGLVSRTVFGTTTYYNRARRYTDRKGRFKRFGFAILNDIEFSSNEYQSYPLITKTTSQASQIVNNNSYFWCGNPLTNQAFQYPLVWNKDPLTNANLTYQLNVLSYYVNLYIFGLKFFTDNFIVKNHDILRGSRLYLYRDGTTYDMFETIFVKSGYTNTVTLRDNFYLGDGNIEYDSTGNQINFIGIDLTGVTSWAIGLPNDNDSTIDLLVACNEPLNGIKFVNRHIRPDVYEIGDYIQEAPLVVELSFSETINLASNINYRVFEFPIESLSSTLQLQDSLIFEISTPVEVSFSETISLLSNVQESAFIYPIEDEYEPNVLNIIDSLLFEISTPVEIAFSDTIVLQSTIDDSIFMYPEELEFEPNTLTLVEDLQFEISTPVEVSFTDSITILSNIQDNQFIFPEELEFDPNNLVLLEDLQFEISTPIEIALSDTMNLSAVVSESYDIVDWRSGGVVPVGANACAVIGDIGNVRCDSSCAFVEVDTYIAQTDESTTQPTCVPEATYTSCVQNGAFWTCTVYNAQITYSNCEECVQVVSLT